VNQGFTWAEIRIIIGLSQSTGKHEENDDQSTQGVNRLHLKEVKVEIPMVYHDRLI
jgi:hypothetical protein